MIDLRKLNTRYEEIKQNIANRFMDIDLDRVLSLQQQRSGLIQQVEQLRQQRNENSRKMKQKLEPEERNVLIEEGKQLKEQIAETGDELSKLEKEFYDLASRIPNFAHPDAPIGKEEKDNLEIRRWGDPRAFDFPAKDHIELAEELDLIDFDAAVKVTGTKFYYLKHEAVILELALQRYALDILQKHGFTLMMTPDMAKESVAAGIGFQPRGPESNIYTVEETELCLVGTAEITLGAYHAQEILNEKDLPVCFSGISHCFRKEAGAAGQYSKGLYRVHQFSKVEMLVLTLPEESEAMHERMVGIEEEIFQGLEIPYRVVDTCTGDLGAPAYRKYDLEAWMPGRGENGGWGEITSASNCTDYQARNLKVRFRRNDGSEFAHILNGTAVAVSRAIISILENHQQADGSIRMPEKLIPYTGFPEIRR